MLQIIGWLLCVYLIVKGFELVAMKQTAAYIGAALAFLAAPIFFVLINEQVAASNQPFGQLGSSSPIQADPQIEAQVEADVAAADAAVDKALKDAQAAIDNAAQAVEGAGN